MRIVLEIKYYPGDFQALIYGFIIGLIVEITGNYFVGYQNFANPSFLGIPAWLPIAWAYGFMAMKRIGVLIYKVSKKHY